MVPADMNPFDFEGKKFCCRTRPGSGRTGPSSCSVIRASRPRGAGFHRMWHHNPDVLWGSWSAAERCSRIVLSAAAICFISPPTHTHTHTLLSVISRPLSAARGRGEASLRRHAGRSAKVCFGVWKGAPVPGGAPAEAPGVRFVYNTSLAVWRSLSPQQHHWVSNANWSPGTFTNGSS